MTEAWLLVEGSDDWHVVCQLCRMFGVPNNAFSLKERGEGGVDELLRRIPVYLKSSELQVLGIVADANTSLHSRWQSIHGKLKGAGYEDMPMTPKPGGTIISQTGRPDVGVWIWPDNVGSGILEDFVISLASADDSRLLRMASDAVDQIPISERRFPETQRSKAVVHTYLAWQKTPGSPMGLALRQGYLDAHGPLAFSFIRWLGRLFDFAVELGCVDEVASTREE